MEIKELSRDNVAEAYVAQGYPLVKGKILKGKELMAKSCSLFLARFKQTLQEDNVQKLQVYYADMMEDLINLMSKSRTQFKNPYEDKNKQALQWYKKLSPAKSGLKEARIDLMQKFYEFTGMKTEAVRDQLNELLASLANVMEQQGLEVSKVETTRKSMRAKLGGFDKGVYIDSVSHVNTNAINY
jgi:galactose-1-phosphate uridylyltransferase